MIERIEVLKGGQGLYYGTQAVGGVINVVTKAFTGETDGAVEAGYDTNEGYHFNGYVRDGFGDHYFVGFASYDEAEGFQPFDDAGLPAQRDRSQPRLPRPHVGGKYAFEPSDAFRLSAVVPARRWPRSTSPRPRTCSRTGTSATKRSPRSRSTGRRASASRSMPRATGTTGIRPTCSSTTSSAPTGSPTGRSPRSTTAKCGATRTAA